MLSGIAKGGIFDWDRSSGEGVRCGDREEAEEAGNGLESDGGSLSYHFEKLIPKWGLGGSLGEDCGCGCDRLTPQSFTCIVPEELHGLWDSKSGIIKKGEAQVMKTLEVDGPLWQEGKVFVSYCPELDVSSCGDTVEEARANLRAAIRLFLEEAERMGTLNAILIEAG